jgi:putative Mn2+ efflux pump MntP
MAIAVALGMDAMSVCMAIGVRWHGRRQQFRLAWHMGLFQVLMPLVGYATGQKTAGTFAAAGKYLATAIVVGIGVKMLYEAIKSHPGAVAQRTEEAMERAEQSVEKALHVSHGRAAPTIGNSPDMPARIPNRSETKILTDGGIGGDMAPDARKDPTRGWSLMALSLATSVDALLVGFSLGLRGSAGIWATSVVIGATAAAMALCGIAIGRRVGVALGRPAEIIGAAALIVLGVTFLAF